MLMPKYSADVPSYITTPDSVETRIGRLKFKNEAPDQKTVKLLYDQLDFTRGIEAFFVGLPAASLYALCNGFTQAGSRVISNRASDASDTVHAEGVKEWSQWTKGGS